jgi:hypothetical protein
VGGGKERKRKRARESFYLGIKVDDGRLGHLLVTVLVHTHERAVRLRHALATARRQNAHQLLEGEEGLAEAELRLEVAYVLRDVFSEGGEVVGVVPAREFINVNDLLVISI